MGTTWGLLAEVAATPTRLFGLTSSDWATFSAFAGVISLILAAGSMIFAGGRFRELVNRLNKRFEEADEDRNLIHELRTHYETHNVRIQALEQARLLGDQRDDERWRRLEDRMDRQNSDIRGLTTELSRINFGRREGDGT